MKKYVILTTSRPTESTLASHPEYKTQYFLKGKKGFCLNDGGHTESYDLSNYVTLTGIKNYGYDRLSGAKAALRGAEKIDAWETKMGHWTTESEILEVEV